MQINERQIALRSKEGNFASLNDYFDKRTVKVMPFIAIGVVVAGARFAKIPSSLVTGNLAIGATTAQSSGQIMAGLGAWTIGTGAADLTTVVDSSGNILNLVEIRTAGTDDQIYSGGNRVYGLLTAGATTTDGAAITANPSENLEITFVTISDGVLTDVALTATVEFELNKIYSLRQSATLEMERGVRDVSIVGSTVPTPYFAQYIITTAGATGETLTIASGAFSGSAVATKSGDYVAIGGNITGSTPFNQNDFIVCLNGVEQEKGTDVAYSASGVITLNVALDIADVITIKARF